MNDEELKEKLDEVYTIGFKNGQIEMKNKVLKKINRDWSMVADLNPVVKILNTISKIRLSKPKLD